MSSLVQPENPCKAVRPTRRGWQGTWVQISASLLLAAAVYGRLGAAQSCRALVDKMGNKMSREVAVMRTKRAERNSSQYLNTCSVRH